MLYKSNASGHLYFSWYQQKNSQYFTIEYVVTCGFFLCRCYNFWGCFLLFLIFWVFLIIKRCWILSNTFPASIRMTMWLFPLCSINMVYYIYWFLYLELPLHFWNTSHLVLMYKPLNILLNLFASILLMILASIIIRNIDLQLSFVVVSLSGFSIRAMLTLWERRCLFFNFLQEFEENWYYFFFKHLIQFTSETMWPGLSLFGKVLITDLISLLVTVLFESSVSS